MEQNSKQIEPVEAAAQIFAVIKEKEEHKEVLKLDLVSTLGSHVLDLNEAINLKTTHNPTTMIDKQRNAIKETVLKYQRLRNQCLQPNFVMKTLGVTKEVLEKGSIPEDLELRAKELTLAKLKRQGQSYKSFNQNILYVMDSANQKEQLMNELEQNPDPKQKLDANLKDVVSRIADGSKFQKKLEDV